LVAASIARFPTARRCRATQSKIALDPLGNPSRLLVKRGANMAIAGRCGSHQRYLVIEIELIEIHASAPECKRERTVSQPRAPTERVCSWFSEYGHSWTLFQCGT
jgi:hypothetical protein